ncbi:type I restriction-modification enzyme R subunit C-terminal domain-containing protein [Nostoc sp. UHCC 0302]|uniref:type I restriction-modification enzyme R subunit C-terminal domain-containing protein n=1 Tax=Nostoc sp. UHCC 0302 TaxID=3134896 RepID=UPI00311CAB0C
MEKLSAVGSAISSLRDATRSLLPQKGTMSFSTRRCANTYASASLLRAMSTMGYAYALLFNAEAVESREKFEEVTGKNFSLKRFIRQLVGLDRNAAKQAFSRYLEGNNFNANQIRFVEYIVDHLTQNGVIDIGLLY